MKHEFTIPSYMVPDVQRKHRGLCRRAKKLGQRGPELTIGSPFRKEFKRENVLGELTTYYVEHVPVTVEGLTIQVAGWKFAASVEHTPDGNLISKTPGCEDLEVPVKYRTAHQYCDHCKTRRRRKDTFLVTNGESWMQIGRNCLRDFLGIDPGSIVSDLAFLGELRAAEDTDPMGWREGAAWFDLELPIFMKYVFHFVRRFGWLPRSKAEVVEESTASRAWELALPPYSGKEAELKNREIDSINHEDGAKAERALKWAEEEICGKPVNARSDYEHNLAVALANGAVREKTAGIIASLVVGYMRHLERQNERKNDTRVNEWVGSPGERIELVLTIKSIKELDGQYGPVHLHILEDSEGRSFKWFGSAYLYLSADNKDGMPGDTIKAHWAVKKHDEYKGRKQTLLSRPTKIERSSA